MMFHTLLSNSFKTLEIHQLRSTSTPVGEIDPVTYYENKYRVIRLHAGG